MAKNQAAETEETEGGPRSQMWKHEAMVEWLTKQTGVDMNTLSAAEVIAYAFAHRVAWRKSTQYRSLVDGRQAQVAQEREARAAERAQAAEARKAEREAAKAAKATKASKEPAKAAKATKGATKATKSGKGKGSKTEENPFD